MVATTLVAAASGCGLELEGEASPEPSEVGPTSSYEGGFVPSPSSGGSTRSGDAGGSLFDRGPTADATTGVRTTADGGASAPDATVVADGDVDEATISPETGSSHGTMDCPPSSDAAPCDLTANVCCTCPDCFAPFPTGCFPALTGCVGVVITGVYARLTCGDSTNCAPGWTCCAQFDTTSALTGSSCLSACPPTGAAPLCITSAECTTGTSCRPLASAPGFSACQ